MHLSPPCMKFNKTVGVTFSPQRGDRSCLLMASRAHTRHIKRPEVPRSRQSCAVQHGRNVSACYLLSLTSACSQSALQVHVNSFRPHMRALSALQWDSLCRLRERSTSGNRCPSKCHWSPLVQRLNGNLHLFQLYVTATSCTAPWSAEADKNEIRLSHARHRHRSPSSASSFPGSWSTILAIVGTMLGMPLSKIGKATPTGDRSSRVSLLYSSGLWTKASTRRR